MEPASLQAPFFCVISQFFADYRTDSEKSCIFAPETLNNNDYGNNDNRKTT